MCAHRHQSWVLCSQYSLVLHLKETARLCACEVWCHSFSSCWRLSNHCSYCGKFTWQERGREQQAKQQVTLVLYHRGQQNAVKLNPQPTHSHAWKATCIPPLCLMFAAAVFRGEEVLRGCMDYIQNFCDHVTPACLWIVPLMHMQKRERKKQLSSSLIDSPHVFWAEGTTPVPKKQMHRVW